MDYQYKIMQKKKIKRDENKKISTTPKVRFKFNNFFCKLLFDKITLIIAFR